MEFSDNSSTQLNGAPQTRRVVAALVLAALLFMLVVFFLRMVSALIMPLLLAAIMAILFHPAFTKIQAAVGGRKHVAAVAVSLLLLLVVFLPLVITGSMLYREMTPWAEQVANPLASGRDWRAYAEGRLDQLLGPVSRQVADYLSIDLGTITNGVVKAVAAIGMAIYTRTVDFLGNLPNLVLSLTTFTLGFYFFVADGSSLALGWERLTPLDPKHDRMVREEFVKVCRGVVWATMLGAVAQAILVVVGLLVVCALSPLELGGWVGLLGLVSLVFAMVPFFGVAIVWGAVAIYLLAHQYVAAAVFFIAFCAIVVSSADNVVKIVAIKDSAEMHPLLVFVSVFGGMQMMGMMGIFLGPVIGAIILSVARVLRFEFIRLGWRRPDAANIVVPSP